MADPTLTNTQEALNRLQPTSRKKPVSNATRRVQLQSDVLKQAAGITSEIAALNAEQAAAAAETAKMEDQTAADTALLDVIQRDLPALAAGRAGAGGSGAIGEVWTATDGTTFTNFENYLTYQETLDGKRQGRQSAFDLLFQEFSSYGLGSLVEPLKNLITDPTVPPSEFTIRLRQTEPYKRRFAANQARIAKGLRALDEGTYLELEDSYQNIMRRYGLPQSYYTRGELGRQEGFEKFIESDVSPVEVEERLTLGMNRVKNGPPEVMRELNVLFGDKISNGDIIAYVLDPKNALSEIQRKVSAAEIAAGAAAAGLTVGGVDPRDIAARQRRAEELLGYGVTAEEARRGFQTVAEVAPRGGQLAEIYKETPYTQQMAEAEVFGTAGAVEARKKRERLVGREQAAFGGTSGAFQGALSRDRQGAF